MKRMTIKYFRPTPDEAVTPRQGLITEETTLLSDAGIIQHGIRFSGSELGMLNCIAVTGSVKRPFVPSPLMVETCALYRTVMVMGEQDFIMTTNQYSAELHHVSRGEEQRLRILVQEARSAFNRFGYRTQEELTQA